MKVLGIIPARFESSRFPGKPLVDIAGKSMIQRVYEQSKNSGIINELVVATDDKRIFDHVLSFGGNVVMTSNEHTSGTDRCGEVLKNHSGFDVVINIQGDEPLIKPEQLDSVLSLFEAENVEIGTLVKKMNNIEDVLNPNRVKVVLDKSKNGIYFSRSPIPFIANVKQNEWFTHADFWKHIGIYAWRTETLKSIVKLAKTDLEKQESLEQLRWLYNGYKIATIETTIETPNVDVPDDVQKVLALLNN